jgi:hypothetical protein
VAFKAEELTAKIFPFAQGGAWEANAPCPQDTLTKGKQPPCAQSTHAPCAEHTRPPAPPPCPQDTHAPHKAGGDGPGVDLALLQAQLRDRMAAGPLAGTL